MDASVFSRNQGIKTAATATLLAKLLAGHRHTIGKFKPQEIAGCRNQINLGAEELMWKGNLGRTEIAEPNSVERSMPSSPLLPYFYTTNLPASPVYSPIAPPIS